MAQWKASIISSALWNWPVDRIFIAMTTKSRQHLFGSSIRASAERAAAARKEADRLACEAWNQRMLGYKGPAQPWLRYTPNCSTRYRAAAEVDTYPRTGALHALQRLLASPRLSVQAQSPGRAAADEDFGKRSAVDVVAR